MVESKWSDEEIITGLQAQHGAAEEAVVRAYARVVLSLACQQGLNLADAKDVMNRVLLTAIEQGREGLLTAPLGPWLSTVTKRRAIDRYRRDRTRRKRDAAVMDELMLAQRNDGAEPDPKSVALVADAMDRLREREEKRCGSRSEISDVQVLEWIGNGATVQDLADNLNTSTNTAKQRRRRVLGYFKEEVLRLSRERNISVPGRSTAEREKHATANR